MLIGSVTHATRELMSVAPDAMDLRWSISRDNRTIYFARQVQQADIWADAIEIGAPLDQEANRFGLTARQPPPALNRSRA
jgi:hypothetical protein